MRSNLESIYALLEYINNNNNNMHNTHKHTHTHTHTI